MNLIVTTTCAQCGQVLGQAYLVSPDGRFTYREDISNAHQCQPPRPRTASQMAVYIVARWMEKERLAGHQRLTVAEVSSLEQIIAEEWGRC